MAKKLKTLAFSAAANCTYIYLCFMVLLLGMREFLRPPLLLGMPFEIAAADTEFKKRVETSFPAGTTNEQITQELTAQGFEVNPVKDHKVVASYKEHAIVCRFNWRVSWKVDEQAKIENLDASYGDTCL